MKPKGEYTRILYKFEYHIEDTKCRDCLYFQGKVRGCLLTTCYCEDIKAEATANGKIKRAWRIKSWDM